MERAEWIHRPISQQQRIEIMLRAERKENDTQIATAMRLSRSVVRKWRRKAKGHGVEGLITLMGRPKSGPCGHYPKEMRQVLKEWCIGHPGWGAGTLRAELAQDMRFANQPIPSRSRISAYMSSEGLTRVYQRHTALSNPPPKTATECHEEWELDAQGAFKVPGIGLVCLLNFGDVVSHVRSSWACLNRRKAAGPDYQLALRRGFFCFGMPHRISLDHDSAFFDNASPSPFPSLFHLWLIALGIEVRFLEHCPPREHAFIERSHQIVYGQTIPGQSFTPASLQPYLDQRLTFLNQSYPSRSLHGQAPFTAFPQAIHSGREYRPEWEEEMLDLHKVYDYLSKQEWLRQVTPAGQVGLGSHRYGLGKAWGKQIVRFTFDPNRHEFLCSSLTGQSTQRLAPADLSKQTLMGELNLSAFIHHQYAFPWSFRSERANQTAVMIGTTL